MRIDNKIYDELAKVLRLENSYRCPCDRNLLSFLEADTYERKRELAESAYRAFGDADNASKIDIAEELARFEEATGPLTIVYRDHLVHSIYVFILGLVLHHKWPCLKRGYGNTTSDSNADFAYYWALTALFHDCAYPVDLAIRSVDGFLDRILETTGKRSIMRVNSKVLCERLWYTLLNENEDIKHPIKVICESITRTLRCNAGDANDVILRSVADGEERGLFDHGIWGAAILLKIWEQIASTRNIPLDDFRDKYMPVISAIFLHNVFDYLWQTVIHAGDDNLRLRSESHPLAYLLILCDRLQEWNRKDFGSNCADEYLETAGYDIDFMDDRLWMTMPITKYKKVSKSLYRTLMLYPNQVVIEGV
jgi:hypothetical protein